MYLLFPSHICLEVPKQTIRGDNQLHLVLFGIFESFQGFLIFPGYPIDLQVYDSSEAYNSSKFGLRTNPVPRDMSMVGDVVGQGKPAQLIPERVR